MRKKYKTALCIVLAVIIIIIPFWYYNNYSIKINNQSLVSDKVNEDIHIAVMSDIHNTEYGKDNSRLIAKLKKISPDAILVLGDTYSRYCDDKIDWAVELLTRFTEIADVYVITGEHDTDAIYKDKLSEVKKIHLMNYNKADITINNNDVCIYGINNVYYTNTFDINNAFSKPDSNKLNILMAHIPNIDGFESFDTDIIFCGDTHGGIVRLPFLGPIYYKGYILPKLTYSGTMTDKGMYTFDNKKMFVTSGVGMYPLPIRLNNRPEICSITITKGE